MGSWICYWNFVDPDYVFEFPFYEGECEEVFTSRPKLEAL